MQMNDPQKINCMGSNLICGRKAPGGPKWHCLPISTAISSVLIWSCLLEDAGPGRSAVDERRALPGVFGQVPGERGRRVQGGHQEGFGLPPQAKPLQTQEELCPPMTAAHFGWSDVVLS